MLKEVIILPKSSLPAEPHSPSQLGKKSDESVRGTAEELQQHFTTKAPKGEFVVCIAGQDGEVKSEKAEGKRISKENRLRP